MTTINGSVCIVTGAASGIGRSLAVGAAARGAKRVIGTDVNGDGLQETAGLLGSTTVSLESHQFDLGSSEQVDRFLADVLPTLNQDRLILFNNAGIALCSGRFQDTPLDEFVRLLDINLMAVLRLTKGFYRYLLEHGEGHVVNISSVFGLGGFDGNAAYCTSKFAVRGFTETLRMELIQSKVNVTCVHPGGIKTNITRNAKPSGTFVTQEYHQSLVKDFDQIARTSPEEAARQILRAVERNQTRLVIGTDGKVLDWLTRIFPTYYTQLFLRQYKKRLVNPYND